MPEKTPQKVNSFADAVTSYCDSNARKHEQEAAKNKKEFQDSMYSMKSYETSRSDLLGWGTYFIQITVGTTRSIIARIKRPRTGEQSATMWTRSESGKASLSYRQYFCTEINTGMILPCLYLLAQHNASGRKQLLQSKQIYQFTCLSEFVSFGLVFVFLFVFGFEITLVYVSK